MNWLPPVRDPGLSSGGGGHKLHSAAPWMTLSATVAECICYVLAHSAHANYLVRSCMGQRSTAELALILLLATLKSARPLGAPTARSAAPPAGARALAARAAPLSRPPPGHAPAPPATRGSCQPAAWPIPRHRSARNAATVSVCEPGVCRLLYLLFCIQAGSALEMVCPVVTQHHS